MKKILTFFSLVLLLFASCSRIEFDPNQSVDMYSDERLNFKAIARLRGKAETDSVIKIALIGDTQIDYENTGELVAAINKIPDIDFVIHTGDITDHGVFQEFKWAASHLKRLHAPFLAVVGNHDVVAKGKSVYLQMFGNTDFSFVYGRTRFIFFDSNSREYEFGGLIPNLGWLQQEMQVQEDSLFSQVVLVSHVPYFDGDFDPALRDPFTHLLNTTNRSIPILASLNGHQHDGFEVSTPECPVIHLAPGSANRRTFMIATIKGGELTYEKRTL